MISSLSLFSILYTFLEWSGVITATIGIYMTWQVRRGQINLERISKEKLEVALSNPPERWWKIGFKSLLYTLLVVASGPVTWFLCAKALSNHDFQRGFIGIGGSVVVLIVLNFWFLKILTEFTWARKLSNFYAFKFGSADSTKDTFDSLAYVLAYLGGIIEIVLKIFPVPHTPEQFLTNVMGGVIWVIIVGLLIFFSSEPGESKADQGVYVVDRIDN